MDSSKQTTAAYFSEYPVFMAGSKSWTFKNYISVSDVETPCNHMKINLDLMSFRITLNDLKISEMRLFTSNIACPKSTLRVWETRPGEEWSNEFLTLPKDFIAS